MSGSTGASRRLRNAVLWLLLAMLSCALTFVVWLWGVFSGGLDVREMCAVVKGQDFDDAYRSSHPHEPNQWFPLHNRCNAAYDLVPAWVNPALVGLTLITLCCLLAAAATTVTRVRRQRGPTSVSVGGASFGVAVATLVKGGSGDRQAVGTGVGGPLDPGDSRRGSPGCPPGSGAGER